MLRNIIFSRYGGGPLSFAAEGDEDKGGGGNPASQAAALTALEAKYGTARGALAVLYDENFQLRQKNRDLRKEVKGLAPSEGAQTLTKDEATIYQALKALNLTPEQITAALSERDTLKGKVEGMLRDASFSEAAEALNYKSKVLADLLRSRGMEVEMREVEVEENGAKSKRRTPYGKLTSEAADKFTPLQDYIKSNLSDYLPSLQQQDGKDSPDGGITYPEQDGRGKVPRQTDVVDSHMGVYVTPGKRD